MKKNSTHSSQGFGLVQVLVAIAISSILALALATMFIESGKSAQHLETKNSEWGLIQAVRVELSTSQTCRAAIGTSFVLTPDASNEMNFAMKIGNEEIKPETSSNIFKLNISDFKLRNIRKIQNNVDNNLYTADIAITVNSLAQKSTPFSSKSVASFFIKTDKSETLIDCFASLSELVGPLEENLCRLVGGTYNPTTRECTPRTTASAGAGEPCKVPSSENWGGTVTVPASSEIKLRSFGYCEKFKEKADDGYILVSTGFGQDSSVTSRRGVYSAVPPKDLGLNLPEGTDIAHVPGQSHDWPYDAYFIRHPTQNLRQLPAMKNLGVYMNPGCLDPSGSLPSLSYFSNGKSCFNGIWKEPPGEAGIISGPGDGGDGAGGDGGGG